MPQRIRKDACYYLRVYRAERDLDQAAAAKAFGISASFWSLLEGGQRRPSPELAADLAAATGATLAIMLRLKKAS